MWISTIPYDEAEGELRSHYDRQARALGEPTEMTTAGSLHPALVAARLDLYAATEKCPSRLTPHQRNLISFVTSAINGTVHCMSQVTIKLRQTGLEDEAIAKLASDPDCFESLWPAARRRRGRALRSEAHPLAGVGDRGRRRGAASGRSRRPRHHRRQRPVRPPQLRQPGGHGARHPLGGGPRLPRLLRHPPEAELSEAGARAARERSEHERESRRTARRWHPSAGIATPPRRSRRWRGCGRLRWPRRSSAA